jgi:predicted dehydrogenase
MSVAKTLNLALVGCGAIFKVHLDAIRRGAPEIVVTAVVDPDATRRADAAERTGARAFASLDQALAAGGFDAVDLMVPHTLHEQLALESLAAGKHVLLEKPMATDLAACERMLAAWRKSGLVFMIAENAQYWPDILEACRLIEAGAIGVPVTARASIFFPPIDDYYGDTRAWRFDREQAGGGIVIDTGSHWIRPLRMLMGEIEEVVAALDRPVTAMQGESLARALIRFRSGKIGQFDALLTYGPMAPELFFRVTGADGELTIDGLGRVMLYDRGHPGGRKVGETRGYFESYPPEFADFASAILHGRPLAAGPEVALGELRTALAMYRSVETKRWEPVWKP